MKRNKLFMVFILTLSLIMSAMAPVLVSANDGKDYTHVLGDFERLMANNEAAKLAYNQLLAFANSKNNLSASNCIKDKFGNPLVSGKKYYMVPNGGFLDLDSSQENGTKGITYEKFMFNHYPILSSGMGTPVQVYHKDAKGVNGINIAKNDQVRFKFSGDDRYFDFRNGNGWGNISLEDNPSEGVGTLLQYDNDSNKVYVRTAEVTRYYDKFGKMCDWYQADREITSYAWFDFKRGTFFNHKKRWLATEFFVSPWRPSGFQFIPAN